VGPDSPIPSGIYGPGIERRGQMQILDVYTAQVYDTLARSLGVASPSPCVSNGTHLAHLAARRLPELGLLSERNRVYIVIGSLVAGRLSPGWPRALSVPVLCQNGL